MAKINFRVILKFIGILLCMEAVFMLMPLLVALYYDDGDAPAFIKSILITALAGCALFYFFKDSRNEVGKRESYLVVTSIWFFFTIFGMLPFCFMPNSMSITDAFFETVSGLTTTGASVLKNVETLPHGILFWRSFSQLIGGMGIILLTIAILPMLNHQGGLLLFNSEVTGITHEKLKPKIGETSKKLWSVYVSLTAILCILLCLGPMKPFDAICHAFSTMATGGFSTKQASLSHWNSPYIDYVITIFTFIAGINFALVYRAVTGDFKKLFSNEETKWYTVITLGATSLVVLGLYLTGQNGTFEETLRISLTQVVTVITSTGYTVGDYVAWGPFFTTIFLLLMFFGACAGSTCGGAKIDRLVVLAKNTKNEFYRAIHPNAILPVRVNKKAISHEVVSKILAFILVYVMVLIAGSVILSALGLSIEEAFGSTLSCLSNIGPGAGATGPAGNYAFIPTIGKWVLSIIMLVGRLELFTVLILFTSYFWKNS
ncbi:MAG TPA: TrkH family potassium uptake protein [Candidatus Barnesiella excrementigallinarum]|nr:TrkH family potassium uptake protein [Candidatus Barnesiella excrementigallinarum]